MLPILLAMVDGEDQKAQFARFYHQYKLDLYRYALSILKSPPLAEEAVQEAWLRCVDNFEKFFSISCEKRLPWMVIVVKNISLNILKKETRYVSMEPDWAPDPDPGPQEQGDILALIRAMPEQYRAILELKFVLEWSDKEIARWMKLPLGTVSTRIWRGRKLLQEKLREEGYHL